MDKNVTWRSLGIARGRNVLRGRQQQQHEQQPARDDERWRRPGEAAMTRRRTGVWLGFDEALGELGLSLQHTNGEA